jgi:hypothetical protein
MPVKRCSICGAAQELSLKDWQYLDPSEGPFCCSKPCIKRWIFSEHTLSTLSPDVPLNPPAGDYRSNYEMAVAKWLADEKIPALYENFEFTWSNGKRYTPDFYVWSRECYLEVKGKWTPQSRDKFRSFRQANPTISLLVIPWTLSPQFMRKEMKNLWPKPKSLT